MCGDYRISEKAMSESCWFVYIVHCKDDSLYTGVTTDVERRVTEHNSKAKSARYTRARQPVKLAYFEPAASRSAACKREAAIKALPRQEKQVLCQQVVKK